jgi:hypothetical protein
MRNVHLLWILRPIVTPVFCGICSSRCICMWYGNLVLVQPVVWRLFLWCTCAALSVASRTAVCGRWVGVGVRRAIVGGHVIAWLWKMSAILLQL